ncbi:MAG TPA: hypothetical protein PKD74_00830 [Candidatus Dependentiae bacterium]|nr:hypothetical protein [Candidatus Dependentiae bacterium]
MNLIKNIALILTGSLITFCNLHCAAERYQHTEAAHSEEDQLQEALRLSRNEYRRQQIREAEQREEAALQEALKISAQEEIERQRQIQALEKLEREVLQEKAQLQEAIRLSRNEYRRQQIREAEQREEAALQEALKISAQEEIERQRQIQALEKTEKEAQATKIQQLPLPNYDYIVLYNANVPIENIELRQGTSTTIGRPRSPFNAPKDRSIWEIPVEHGATGPFILTVKTNTTYHRWAIPVFKPSPDKELGIIQNEEKQEIVLQQIIETATGYRAHGINAHDIIP